MESKYCKITKLSENLLKADCHSIKTLKYLKGLIEKPGDVSHFRKKNGLKNLIKFLDETGCQAIALSLLGNCCVEEDSSIFITKINITSRLFEILSESKDTYTSKSVSRVLGLMCMHESCLHSVLMTPGAAKVLVGSLGAHELNEMFLQAHLKTIKIMSKGRYKHEMMYEGVTCSLSSLLKDPLSQNLSKEILKLIYHFFNGKWTDTAGSHDKCQSTLAILVEIVNGKGELSSRVNNFIIHQLLPISTLWRYLGSSGVVDLLVDNFRASQCYLEKHKLLQCTAHALSEARNRLPFKSNGGCDMLMDCLKDPLMRPTFSSILNILYHFTNDSFENTHLNFLSTVSFCFELVKERNFFNLSRITTKFLYAGEIYVLKDDGNELEQNPDDDTVESHSEKSDINDMEIPAKKKKLHMDEYPGKSTRKDENAEKRQSSELCSSALKFLSGLAKQQKLHNHFDNPQRIRTLTHAIASFPGDQNLHEIFIFLSYNPLFFRILLSETVVPMLHLMTKIYPNQPFLHSSFSKLMSSMSGMVYKYDVPFDIRKLVSSHQSRLKSILLLCYISKSAFPHPSSHSLDSLWRFLSRDVLFAETSAMVELVRSMYDHQHPFRLLAITSYCHLLSSLEDSCECEVDECMVEKKEVTERDYDVSFFVGQECVRSVKSRLMQHSDVFIAMFDGAFSEASSAHVVMTDTSPEAFRLFNDILLSGCISLAFKDYNCDTLIGVLQLANKYMLAGLEGQMVNLIRSRFPAYFDAILASNCLLSSRPLLVCCLLHVCKSVSRTNNITPSSPDTFRTSKITFQSFTYILNLLSQQELTDISTKLIKSLCIHQVYK